MTQVKEGDILAGKYRVERVLGVGGMGVVVSALHIQLEERVAIKFLLPEALANPDAVARFGREARAAVKIKSEHVARVTDVGTLESGAPYMIMEFLHGRDLAAIVHDGGPLPVPLAVEYVLQACEALAEAHHMGIVHRDLKPANLFLTTRADGTPSVKVLDFGISKVTSPDGSADMGMTKTQAIMGSPLYMSPEQMASSRDVDARSDIWAAGTVLYELVTGRVPFQAETMPQLCALILQHDPPAPRSFQPGIPEGLQQVIMKALQKQRANRYQNVAEFAAALAEFSPYAGPRSAERISRILGGGTPSLSSSDMNQQRVASQAGAITSTDQGWGTTMTQRRGKALWVTLGGIIVAGAAAAFFFIGQKPADPPAVTSEHAPAAPPPPPAPAPTPDTPTVVPVAVPETPPATSASAEPEPPVVKTTTKTTPRPTTKKPGGKATAEKTAAPPPKNDPPPQPKFDPLSDRN